MLPIDDGPLNAICNSDARDSWAPRERHESDFENDVKVM